MKIWVDDVRTPPIEYDTCVQSVFQTIVKIIWAETRKEEIEVIDLDHDAGEYFSDGGDYIKILDWLEETGRNYPIRIHSLNPVGVQNMRKIIERNGWKEV